ncbi:transposase InsO family protein [Methylobacterium sp. 1030]
MTETVRRAIQARQEGVTAAAKRYGISATTVQKWRSRQTSTNARMGPKEPRSSVLSLELQRLLGKLTLGTEILREAMERVAAPPQTVALARDLVAGGRPASAVAAALSVSRPHLASSRQASPAWKPMGLRGRPPAPDAALLGAIQALIADLPTYGYRRVHALLRRQAERDGRPAPNAKRVYRVMKVYGLLQRHAGGAETRRHEGKVAVAVRNTRWCLDGLEIAAENGERVRLAFALDCCDREAISYVATTAGITGEDVRDLMVAAIEYRFGPVNQLPSLIEWLTDNGSCYVARDTRRFARDLGLVPKTTPLERPQSNGMAEAFVQTLKRDYVRVSVLPDAESVLRQLPVWLAHYNDLHPHRALGYRSPREFITRSTKEILSGLQGGQQQGALQVPAPTSTLSTVSRSRAIPG